MNNEYLDTKEVADQIGVTRKTVISYINSKRLPGICLTPRNKGKGRREYRVLRRDLEEYLLKLKTEKG